MISGTPSACRGLRVPQHVINPGADDDVGGWIGDRRPPARAPKWSPSIRLQDRRTPLHGPPTQTRTAAVPKRNCPRSRSSSTYGRPKGAVNDLRANRTSRRKPRASAPRNDAAKTSPTFRPEPHRPPFTRPVRLRYALGDCGANAARPTGPRRATAHRPVGRQQGATSPYHSAIVRIRRASYRSIDRQTSRDPQWQRPNTT